MISKNRQTLAKPLITIMIAAVVAVITSSSVASIASAQQPQSTGSKSGTLASLQYGKDGKPVWIISGTWNIKNSTSPTFNATFNMVRLNGSAPHKHTITEFKLTDGPTNYNIASTYNGTATILMKEGPVTGVPISIKLMGPSAMSLWIDPSKT